MRNQTKEDEEMTAQIKRFTLGLTILIVTIGLIGLCWNVWAAKGDQNPSQEETTPNVAIADAGKLVTGNTAFAFDLYKKLSEEGENLFFSPYSISLALAMTYAGARSTTEEQMAETLHFTTLGQDRLHPAFNALALELASRGEDPASTKETEEEKKDRFQLHVANALWGQDGHGFLPDFTALLETHYDAGLRLANFVGAPEDARRNINDWVSDETEERIEDLLPPGSITPLTRLVLTNAIYFKATWEYRFAKCTADGTFTLLDGSQVTVSMMQRIAKFKYVEGKGSYKAIELPYVGDELSMVILLPATSQFEEFSQGLNAEQVHDILNNMKDTEDIHLYMPKFEYTSGFNLNATLTDLGMPDAFVLGAADFSGMDGSRELFMGDVFHKAFVSVDENGTEAAAATAVIMPCMQATEFKLNRPFIFLIRDIETGTILFMGQVMNPTGT
jgi:serpin B